MCIDFSTPGIGSNISGSSCALVADRADQGALGATRNVHLETVRAYLRLDGLDLLRACIRLHYDDHGRFSKKIGRPLGPPDGC